MNTLFTVVSLPVHMYVSCCYCCIEGIFEFLRQFYVWLVFVVKMLVNPCPGPNRNAMYFHSFRRTKCSNSQLSQCSVWILFVVVAVVFVLSNDVDGLCYACVCCFIFYVHIFVGGLGKGRTMWGQSKLGGLNAAKNSLTFPVYLPKKIWKHISYPFFILLHFRVIKWYLC